MLMKEVITKTKFSAPKKTVEGGLASSKGIGALSKVNRSLSSVTSSSTASTPKALWPGVFGRSGSSASNSVHSSPATTTSATSTPSSTEATTLSITIPGSNRSSEEQESAATVRPPKIGGRQRVMSLFRKNTAPSSSIKSTSPPPPLPGKLSKSKRASGHGRHASMDSPVTMRNASVDLDRRESINIIIHESPEIMRRSVEEVVESPTSD